MRSVLRGVLAAPVFLAFVAVPFSTIEAQVAEQRLTTPSASFPREFSTIRGLLELPDGRLLIADGLGQALMIVDLATGSADTVGRTGQGPEEYRQPDGLYGLPGNAILLVDLGNGRLTELGPDLSFGQTMPLAQGDPTSGMGMSLRIPQDVDAEGRVYYQGRGSMSPGRPLPDSGTVLRWNRESGVVDTLAIVKLQEMNRTTSGGPNNQNVSISPVPLSPRDGWAAAADGRVAVVRSSPYRVDWVQTNGQIIMGPANEYRPTRIGRDDKIAYLENRLTPGFRPYPLVVTSAGCSHCNGGGYQFEDEPSGALLRPMLGLQASLYDQDGYTGAYWDELTTSSIWVTRGAHDTQVLQVRIDMRKV